MGKFLNCDLSDYCDDCGWVFFLILLIIMVIIIILNIMVQTCKEGCIMKQLLFVTTILISLLTLSILPVQVAAQKTDPESVLRGIFDALSVGDVDRALTFVAENAVAVLIPPPPGSTGVIIGKDKFRERYIQYVANHEHSELSNVEVRGDEVTCSSTVSADEFRALGLASLNFTGYAVVRDGLLRTYTWTITRESLARLESAVGTGSQ